MECIRDCETPSQWSLLNHLFHICDTLSFTIFPDVLVVAFVWTWILTISRIWIWSRFIRIFGVVKIPIIFIPLEQTWVMSTFATIKIVWTLAIGTGYWKLLWQVHFIWIVILIKILWCFINCVWCKGVARSAHPLILHWWGGPRPVYTIAVVRLGCYCSILIVWPGTIISLTTIFEPTIVAHTWSLNIPFAVVF